MSQESPSPRNALPADIPAARLTLRAPRLTDLADLVALADNPEVVAQTASLPHPYREAHGRAFLTLTQAKPDRRLYAIAGGDDTLMGVVGLTFPAGKPPELGYWLGEPHWGRGYAAEAVTALLCAVADTTLVPGVMARVLADNARSIRVLEKSGFRLVERTVSIVERHRGRPLLVMAWEA